jgi:endonuclease YncB( thermonuclease family)
METGMLTLALTLTCFLTSVTDGDTLRAACPEPTRIRIAGIDAPERDECPDPAARATDALQALATGPLTVTPLYQDRYGRTVATVTAQGRDLGQAMLATGLAKAWPHSKTGRALTPRPRGC